MFNGKYFFKPNLGNTAKIISRMGDDYEVRIKPKKAKDNYGLIQIIVGKYQSLRVAIDRVKIELEKNGFKVYRIADDDGLQAGFRSRNWFINDGSFSIEFVQETNRKSAIFRKNSSQV